VNSSSSCGFATRVPIAVWRSPMIRSPSQGPGTARSSTAGRSLVTTGSTIWPLPDDGRAPFGCRFARRVRRCRVRFQAVVASLSTRVVVSSWGWDCGTVLGVGEGRVVGSV
jgi:hypothetical protein